MKRFVSFFLVMTSLGCSSYKGGTISDGNNLIIGLKTPLTTSGLMTLQLLSWTDGMVLSWENDVNVEVERISTSQSSAFGVWTSCKSNETYMCITQCNTNRMEKTNE